MNYAIIITKQFNKHPTQCLMNCYSFVDRILPIHNYIILIYLQSFIHLINYQLKSL